MHALPLKERLEGTAMRAAALQGAANEVPCASSLTDALHALPLRLILLLIKDDSLPSE